MKQLVWLFDNDGTLYNVPKSLEMYVQNIVMIKISKIMKVPLEDVPQIRKELMCKYKTDTGIAAFFLAGIISNFQKFVQETYLTANLNEFGLHNDKRLTKILNKLSGNKFIITNNPKQFAVKITRHLGIYNIFDEIYGIEDLNFIGKPDFSAFNIVLIKINCNANNVIFIDDNIKNIVSAHEFGFRCFYLNNNQNQKANNIACVLKNVKTLKSIYDLQGIMLL